MQCNISQTTARGNRTDMASSTRTPQRAGTWELVQNAQGIRTKGPIKIECEACSLGKAKRIVSRRSPHTQAPRPFWRFYMDIFSLHTSYNGKRAASLIKDEFTGIIFSYLLTDSTQSAFVEALEAFTAYIRRQ